MSESSLEQLLRASAVHSGSISLLRLDGDKWRATVAHHNGHMVHPHDDWRDDPVEALTVALVEDERLSRDLERRYRQIAKYGPATAPEVKAGEMPILDPDFDDMEDLLG